MGLLSSFKEKVGLSEPKGKVVMLVNGVDDMNFGTISTLQNLEPGTYLNGYIDVTAADIPGDATALIEFKFKGKYLEHGYRQVHESNGSSRTQTEDWEVTWLKEKQRSVVRPLDPTPSVPCTQPADGKKVLRYPFTYRIKDGLPPSFKTKLHSTQKCYYTLKVEVSYVNSDLKLHSMKREIYLNGPRPLYTELSMPPPVGYEEKSKVFFNEIEADVRCDAYCYMEGQRAFITAKVHNKSSKVIQVATVSLNEVCNYPYVNRGAFNMVQNWDSSDHVVEKTYRTLELQPGKKYVLKFAIKLPDSMNPTTCEFQSKMGMTKITHNAKIKFEAKGMLTKDCKVRAPVKIAPNPTRYVYSPPVPLEPSYLSQPPLMVVAGPPMPAGADVPPGPPPPYEPMIFATAPPAPWEYMGPQMLHVQLISGEGLPKMDFGALGMGGKADPFVTIWVNGTHVRQSEIIENNLNPYWEENFMFPLSGEEVCAPMKMRFACYDEDGMGSDEKIGEAEIEISVPTEKPITHTVTLKNEKKGVVKERGVLKFTVFPLGM